MIAIITVGCSGSGKSTFAKELVNHSNSYVEINRDNIRFKHFCNGVHDWSLYEFSRENENIVTSIHDAEIMKAFMDNKNVIISDTNLSSYFRNKLHSRLVEIGFDHIRNQVFNVPYEELLKRNNLRGKLSVPESVLFKQFQSFQNFLNEHH